MDCLSSSDFDFINSSVPAKVAAGEVVSPEKHSAGGFSDASKKSDRAAFDYVLDIIHSETLSPVQQKQVMHDTLDCWQEHVNGGFLKYRKSVANDFAAIEWRDGEPGGATMLVSCRKRLYYVIIC